MRTLFLTALLMITSACSLADGLNATIPREGYEVKRDIAYGSDPRQTLDMYIPDNATDAPVIVFFYGGSWKFGSKDDYRFLGQAFASRGFVTAVVDYRLYPQVRYPKFVEDAASATRFVHDHAAEYHGDAHKLFVAGHSAGAYMAMMIGADPHYMAQAGGKREWIRGVIGISGPYDFLPFTDADIKAIFSTAPDEATQPINHITGKMPPVFLATGTADDTVDPRNSARVKAKLERLHSPVEEHLYPDTGHIGIILSLAQGFRGRTTLLNDMTAFVENGKNAD